MSRIYWHAQNEDGAELRGSERAWMGAACNRHFLAALGLDDHDTPGSPHPLRSILPDDYYGKRETGQQWERWVRLALTVPGGDLRLLYVANGKRYHLQPFDCALQNAIDTGGDALRLFGRLHGQCEIHAYVEGPNRSWLAGIIEEGRRHGICRSDEGWEAVAAFLRQRDDAPVVTSYSVCEGFPNAGLVARAGLWSPRRHTAEEWREQISDEPYDAESPDALNWDAWYDLPDAEQWRQGMEALRRSTYTDATGAAWPALELRPDHWADYRFPGAVNGFQLAECARRLQAEGSEDPNA